MAVIVQGLPNGAYHRSETLSPILLAKNRASLVMAGLTDNKTGDFVQGSRVYNYTKSGTYTVGSYTRGTAISTQDPASSQRTITIDQEKYVALATSVFDRTITRSNKLVADLEDAGFALAESFDSYLLGLYGQFTLSSENAGSDIGLALYNHFVNARKTLRDAKVPADGNIFAVVSPSCMSRMLTQESGEQNFFANADMVGSEYPALNGKVVKCLGIPIYESENVPTVTFSSVDYHYNLIFHRSAIGWIEPIAPEVVTMDDASQLGTAHVPIHQFGANVLQPERGLVFMTAV